MAEIQGIRNLDMLPLKTFWHHQMLVSSGQIPQEPVSASNQHEQASSARMILVVVLEVALECIDSFRKNGNLHLWRTGVGACSTMFIDELGLLLLRDGHFGSVWAVHSS